MELNKATVLITGGSEGIGKGLAARLLASGATVMITGRDENKLKQAAVEWPGLLTFQNDIGNPGERERLARHIKKHLSGLNILVNNAGIQRRAGLAADDSPWAERQAEIDILLAGPVHLNHLLITTLLQSGKPALIVNVTSGGAYIPQVFAPVYSACKAALHHYTMILRHSLAATNCRVAELIPPAIQTSLAGQSHGAALDEFCDHIFAKLLKDDQEEVGFGPTAGLQLRVGELSQNELFLENTHRFPVSVY